MSEFDQLEVEFIELLAAVRSELLPSDRDDIQRFVDVGEYGVALETLVGSYLEMKKIAGTEVQELVRRLAEAMEMDAEHLLRDLRGEPNQPSLRDRDGIA